MPQSSDQNKQSFVYNGVEVIKTGRLAMRTASRTNRRDTRQQETLYEIKPLNEQDGTWIIWVKDEDLFKILGQQKGE